MTASRIFNVGDRVVPVDRSWEVYGDVVDGEIDWIYLCEPLAYEVLWTCQDGAQFNELVYAEEIAALPGT